MTDTTIVALAPVLSTTDRTIEAMRILRLAIQQAGDTRSNYARWMIKDALEQFTAGQRQAALLALHKAVEHGKFPHCPPGCPEVRAAAHALAIMQGDDTTDPEVIRLHAMAENALVSALHQLRSAANAPDLLGKATARAMRAATALKRLGASSYSGRT